ncbi:DUF2326 domain-containing protein [Marinifilum sp. N1E240]|uniref:DUF2326 domain-containing protein n=1 Tax=Marinifilum sp. N1E240 TaxID=2608082 RepID=UPI00128D0837|nr:DUF2326 domain-containing protein [Marinifilum sp. N1E240]MPQ45539.1 DUF2326 domain-containing protein [Marinifilum sp. N1E240]
MFLDRLVIYKDDKVLRRINFHKGLNLIVDNTPFTGGNESGNNVGKTTVLRLIDYCLGSEGKDIYTDREFKKDKQSVIKKFLVNHNVYVELTLVDNLDSPRNNYTLERNFLARNLKFNVIDNHKMSADLYKKTLNQIIFNNNSPRLSFRNLIAKFIRNDSFRMSNTLRYLQYMSNSEYEAYHLFLLGLKLEDGMFEEKIILEKEVTREENLIERLEESFTEEDLEQKYSIIQRDIKELEGHKERFNLNPDEKYDLERLNELKVQVANKSQVLGNAKLDLSLIYDSIEELKDGAVDFDISDLEAIYKNAVNLNIGVSKKFKEVVEFHNQMLGNKIAFAEKRIQPLKVKINNLSHSLTDLVEEEEVLSDKLNIVLSLEEYEEILSILNNKYEQKGELEGRLEQIKELKASKEHKEGRIEEIRGFIEKLEDDLKNSIKQFNEYFSSYSRSLYDEDFFLSYDRDKAENIKLEIRHMDMQVGGGMKKGQIAAFDLAYIKYCDKKGIKAPRFVLHDSTEDVHINQLMSIANLAEQVNGQYILSVLNDKFSKYSVGEKLIKDKKVIELSQQDKLLRF